MTDISSNLEKIITKLDGMTSEVVEKQYGTDIASRVEHISKQLDFVEGSGSAGGVMVVHLNGNRLDKTWQEISDAMRSGMPVMVNSVADVEDSLEVSNNWVNVARHNGDDDFVVLINNDSYETNSSDGYPTYDLM